MIYTINYCQNYFLSGDNFKINIRDSDLEFHTISFNLPPNYSECEFINHIKTKMLCISNLRAKNYELKA